MWSTGWRARSIGPPRQEARRRTGRRPCPKGLPSGPRPTRRRTTPARTQAPDETFVTPIEDPHERSAGRVTVSECVDDRTDRTFGHRNRLPDAASSDIRRPTSTVSRHRSRGRLQPTYPVERRLSAKPYGAGTFWVAALIRERAAGDDIAFQQPSDLSAEDAKRGRRVASRRSAAWWAGRQRPECRCPTTSPPSAPRELRGRPGHWRHSTPATWRDGDDARPCSIAGDAASFAIVDVGRSRSSRRPPISARSPGWSAQQPGRHRV